MPSKKTLDYDPYEDEDDDEDEVDGLFKGMKLKAHEGRHTFKTPAGNQSHFKPPSRLYPYDYITGAWLKQIAFAGIGDKRVKSFLSEEALINGSENGGVATRWSEGHEFWEGIIDSTGVHYFFFSGDSIDELCNILAEQVDQVPKANLKPNKEMSFSATGILRPGTLKAVRPVDVDELRSTLLNMKSRLFSLILTQSRGVYAGLAKMGGCVFTLKTQRYELDPQLVTEVGWCHTFKSVSPDGRVMEGDIIKHRIVKDNQQYRNGNKIPDQREHFGFPDEETGEGTKIALEADIMKELNDTLDKLATQGPVLFVVHGAEAEMAYLRAYLSSSMDLWKSEIPGRLMVKDDRSQYPIIVQDSMRLYAAYKEEPEHATTVLSTACKIEGVPCHKILNAGNACYYLMHLYHRIMSHPGS